jgi:hypothetical protein
MSLPLCPVCGKRKIPMVDSAAVVKLGETGSPLRYSVTTIRSYACPCGWSYMTSETIDQLNPETLWVRKFAEDETRERV